MDIVDPDYSEFQAWPQSMLTLLEIERFDSHGISLGKQLDTARLTTSVQLAVLPTSYSLQLINGQRPKLTGIYENTDHMGLRVAACVLHASGATGSLVFTIPVNIAKGKWKSFPALLTWRFTNDPLNLRVSNGQ